jgi:hypothetical protein
MKKIFIAFLISSLVVQSASAQELSPLDFKLKLGQHEFLFPYLFAQDKSPTEGYLLSVADIALLKIELDSFDEILNENLNLLKKECKASVIRCQEDSNERWDKVNIENETLKEKLKLKTQLYKDQKNKTLIYSFSSALVAGLASFVIIKAFY